MKNFSRWFAALAVLALIALPSANAFADSWTGWISDSHCGAGGAKAGHADCAKKCVKGGGKYVFVTGEDKKVFPIDKQDLTDELLAGEVVITGTLADGAIKVESIAKKQ